MAFWVGIFVSAIFLWSAVKIGFYETWAMFFNMVIAIYLAIFLKPIITSTIPSSAETPYGTMFTVLATAAVVFLVLHGASYVFFTGHFTVSLPKVLDIFASGLLGFLAGFLLWSFATLLVFVSPISQEVLVQEIGFNGRLRQTTFPYICRWCNLVNAVVAVPANRQTTEQAIEQLLPAPAVPRKAQTSKTVSPEPDKPPQTAAVKESKTTSALENQPSSGEKSQSESAPAP